MRSDSKKNAPPPNMPPQTMSRFYFDLKGMEEAKKKHSVFPRMAKNSGHRSSEAPPPISSSRMETLQTNQDPLL